MINFKIGGIKKSSLLDYPDKLSAIIFTQGCNFNCGFCHNPGLLKIMSISPSPLEGEGWGGGYNLSSFFDFLKTRIGKLDGVVITGGEPTLHPDLKSVIKKIKNMGFLVKLDTNGYKPDILENLLNDKLIDYIAMDIKAPLEKYSHIVNIPVDIQKIQKSINLLLNSNIDYEFRTTFMPYYLSIDDFKKIAQLIKGAKHYYLQKFEAKTPINNPNLKDEKNYSDEDIQKIINILKQYIDDVHLR